MTRRPDPVALVAGLFFTAIGALGLADRLDAPLLAQLLSTWAVPVALLLLGAALAVPALRRRQDDA